MSFGLQTPRAYIEDIHGRLHDAAASHLKGDITAISIVSINDAAGGQMILADTAYDKRKLASRLRLCADILDQPSPGNVLTRDVVNREAIGRGEPRLEGDGRIA
ncbi:MAG: hypothetical protein Q7T73_13100 [Beijerinckiaceae bacterium]|nr:hypothetical protein [Beijerinckiaceae bacterium]